jgi:anti-sigma regulatory factor (Ser/Thr protein kinase)
VTTRTASAQLPDAPGSAKMARGFMADTLIGWECDNVVDTVVLLTSELVTNAVLHARTPLTVTVVLHARRLRVEVCDRNAVLPRVRPYEVDDATGRGLAMIAAYAAEWGAEARGDGKCVWFEIDT